MSQIPVPPIPLPGGIFLVPTEEQIKRRSKHASKTHPFGLPTRRFDLEEFDTMAYPQKDEMVSVGGRWWWFPGALIGAESEFEWRDNRVFLMEHGGTAVERIGLMRFQPTTA